MKKKNYLLEDLTTEEVKYIRGIIWKTARKCWNKENKKNNVEFKSIFDDDLDQRLLITEDEYNISNYVLTNNYTKNELVLKPYNVIEQSQIVYELNRIAYDSNMNKYIKQLTDKEKLVVFLLYIKHFKVNEVAKLLNISRYTVNYRDKKIKEKIRKVMNKDEK